MTISLSATPPGPIHRRGRRDHQRHVPALPLSREAKQLPALRNSLAVYRMVFGQPRQDDLVEFLLRQMPRETLASRLDLGKEDKILARYLKPDLLIIDDMGMKQLPKRSGEYLFEIIMRRYETRSTMMTSNRPLEDWGKLIGDVPSATAILDRFLHHAEIIQITGKSYRLRHQAQRVNGSVPKEGENGANAASAHVAESVAEKVPTGANAASAHAAESAAEKGTGSPVVKSKGDSWAPSRCSRKVCLSLREAKIMLRPKHRPPMGHPSVFPHGHLSPPPPLGPSRQRSRNSGQARRPRPSADWLLRTGPDCASARARKE